MTPFKRINRNIAAIELSLSLLSQCSGTAEDEVDVFTAKHLMELVREDIGVRMEGIEAAVRSLRDQYEADAATIENQTADGQRAVELDKRVNLALKFLKESLDSAIFLNVRLDDRELREASGNSCCRMSAAMRALRGQGEFDTIRMVDLLSA